MKRLIFVLGVLFIIICSGVLPAAAARDKGEDGLSTRVVDRDHDGYSSSNDCNDRDASIHPGAKDLCGVADMNCDNVIDACPVTDTDGDGVADSIDRCPGTPAGTVVDAIGCEVVVAPVDTDGDGITDSIDLCPGTPAGTVVNASGCTVIVPPVDPPYTDNHYSDPNCVNCHETQAGQVHASVHYQWNGPATKMIGGNNEQGKATGAMNTYCGNIAGNWEGCAACHIGKGMQITQIPTPEALADINCLRCHAAPGEKPTRATCLTCHAKAGGGDALKRGDLALATGNTADRNYDVHMSTSGGNLDCESCHAWLEHKVAGKGSDLRPTDLDVVVTCTNCHASQPHSDSVQNRHTAAVACQSCHIPIYGKNASDSAATEATEYFRTWKGSDAAAPPFHPIHDVANNLVPVYRFWDGDSENYNLGEVPPYDSAKGTYNTSIPQGYLGDGKSKLYPFKYKTVEQPAIVGSHQLIAVDTKVFFATGNAVEGIRSGLVNMKFSADTPYEWVIADTYQSLNHQVSPKGQALQCADCHLNKGRMDLQGELGYAPSRPKSTCATACHSSSKASEWRFGDWVDFTDRHNKHINEKGATCSDCHNFSR
ncbi:MAG: MopE-related protein [Desulfuromonadales bacterium]